MKYPDTNKFAGGRESTLRRGRKGCTLSVVVRVVRNRYDGEKRNPWNEIEYGSNYARAMASFALLPIFSGFTFAVPKKHIGFAPVIPGNFRCMWNLGAGWGDFVCCPFLLVLFTPTSGGFC